MSRRSGRRSARRQHLGNVRPIGRDLLAAALDASPNDFAVSPACCTDDPEQLAEMRQITHDHVIELTGDLRRSGVTWLTWHGEAARAVLREQLSEGRDPEHIAAYDGFLAEHGEHGVLVVAMVEVAPGSADAHGAP